MSTPPTVVTLLTDFGLDDPYVGIMKGVILARAPRARLVDLTHALPPQDVRRAALSLQMAWPYFADGTVHLAVVDPGVGTDRAILAARAAGHLFVAPDNGLLALALAADPAPLVVRVERSDLYAPVVSETFHGRDIMAPVAAALAGGEAVDALGPKVTSWTALKLPRPQVETGRVCGQVLYVDRFGNVATNITPGDLIAGALPSGQARVQVGTCDLQGICPTYAAVASGQACALVNSAGYLEIAVRNGHAACALGLQPDMDVIVTPLGEDA